MAINNEAFTPTIEELPPSTTEGPWYKCYYHVMAKLCRSLDAEEEGYFRRLFDEMQQRRESIPRDGVHHIMRTTPQKAFHVIKKLTEDGLIVERDGQLSNGHAVEVLRERGSRYINPPLQDRRAQRLSTRWQRGNA
jgi:hypothetical protein